ncbi:aminotransferase class V-fold PLP-dependent enzyme [Bacillus wiedmannii]|uniref:aminotransferase class V-fold PLP-dependent enzyme n=1 Tax=Bacillus wiedmannii TaxID=1890302 RepID=UPI00211D59CD|nr:aminotransferase class V-fold PLP-dependent enzyme [Bacillus wiedmannii]
MLTQSYFNTAGAGLIPECVYNTIIEELNYEFERGRVNQGQRKRFQLQLEKVREELASIIHAKSSEIAITNNTTDGVNIILWGLKLKQGDEVLTTNSEHLGALAGLSTLSRQKGVNVRFYKPKNYMFDCSAFFSMITKRTRVIIISQVFWATGGIIPIQEICSYAHERGIVVLVDGAQAVGAMPVDVKALDVDFYVFPAHKWLHGPEGIGTLYIKESMLDIVHQVFAGNASFNKHDGTVYYFPSEGSRRFEIGTRFRPSIHGFETSLTWLYKEIGMNNIFSMIQKNMGMLKAKIIEETALRPIVMETVSILTLPLPEQLNCKNVVKQLEKNNIFVREIKELNAIRISVSFFHTSTHIEALLHQLKQLTLKE